MKKYQISKGHYEKNTSYLIDWRDSSDAVEKLLISRRKWLAKWLSACCRVGQGDGSTTLATQDARSAK